MEPNQLRRPFLNSCHPVAETRAIGQLVPGAQVILVRLLSPVWRIKEMKNKETKIHNYLNNMQKKSINSYYYFFKKPSKIVWNSFFGSKELNSSWKGFLKAEVPGAVWALALFLNVQKSRTQAKPVRRRAI